MKNKYLNKAVTGGGVLIIAVMATNFLNFLFNALLGRFLTLEQFSILTLINSLWFFITIFLNSLASTANNRTAYLSARRGKDVADGFRKYVIRKSIRVSLYLAGMWLVLVPVFGLLFHSSNYILLASISPAIVLGIFAAVNRGFFSGSFAFAKAAIIIFSESVSKLVIALIFIYLGLKPYVYYSIPLSILCAFITALAFSVYLRKRKHVSYHYIYPQKLLFATFLTVFASTAFLSVDVLMARHYLSASNSGAYSLLSLIGKMVYFFGSILNVFILTFASRDTGLNKNSTTNFYRIFAINILLLTVGCVSLGTFGKEVVPILFGPKSLTIVPYLGLYTIAIAFFTLATTFATYHLAKHQYMFAYNGIFMTILTIFSLVVWHSNLGSFVDIILIMCFIYFASSVIMHILYKDTSSYVDDEDRRRFKEFEIEAKDPLSVSLCIPAYNEEKNIGDLLKALVRQQSRLVKINKIVVVSSASTDRTDSIVKKFSEVHPNIELIQERERSGKANAINKFLKQVKDPVVVIQSADTLPMHDAIEKLCRHFLIDDAIGMTGGAPIPLNDKNTFLGYVIHTWWWFHRKIPRFGEIIAFRNILPKVSPRTSVDEAYIQAKFAQMGYKIVHIDDAKIYNKGSESITDIIKQRRRIYNGHTRLLKEENVHISHLTKSSVKLLLFDYKMYGPRQLLWLIGGVLIEIWANILGQYDKIFGDINPVVWDIAKSTKNLRGSKGGKVKHRRK